MKKITQFTQSPLTIALTSALLLGLSSVSYAAPLGDTLKHNLIPVAGATDSSLCIEDVTNTNSCVPTFTHNPAVSQNGLGQVLIFPYYNVRNGNKSFFNITNTSNETLIVKVRFREHHNSRDALDFNLALSPYDAWTGWVEDSANGPVFKTNDTSCTVPAIPPAGAPFSTYGFTGGFDDTGSNSIDRLREGYLEVIGMGRSNGATDNVSILGVPNNIESAIKHVNGTPRNCAMVRAALTGTAGSATPTNAPDHGLPVGSGGIRGEAVSQFVGFGARATHDTVYGVYEPSNPLKGNFSLINSNNGVGAGTEAIAIENFFVEDKTSEATITAGEGHLITAQSFPYFLEPTLASAQGLWNVNGLARVESAFTYTHILNEWAKNSATGAQTDWVVSFPTKSFHADFFCDNIQAGKNKYRTGVIANNIASVGVCPSTGTTGTGLVTLAPFTNQFVETDTTAHTDDATAAVEVGYALYNREEGQAIASGATFSPAPAGTVKSLDYEANVITINGTKNDSILQSMSPSLLDAGSTLGTANGWLDATLTSATDSSGLPVMGFIYKTRNQGDASKAYGQMMKHSFK